MRKLATIQKITNIEPIENADSIEKSTVLGWEVVVKKGEFKIGDIIVYCEVDSILPDKPEFEFLRERKFRIRTIKLKKQVSQGICFPLSILPKGNYNEGDDVTDVIGVKKHDPQLIAENTLFNENSGKPRNAIDKYLRRYNWYRRLTIPVTKAPFPTFLISKSDQDRIQLFPNICSEQSGTDFYYSEKIDGQSASYFIMKNPKLWQVWNPYIFGVCSRNWQLLKADNSSYWNIAKKLKIKEKLISYMKEWDTDNYIAIQGEIIGPRIQANKYKVEENQFYIFEVKEDGNVFDNLEITDFCQETGFASVPMFGKMKLLPSIKEMVDFAKGKSVLNKDTIREGLVFKNTHKHTSFKVINPEFLLKNEE